MWGRLSSSVYWKYSLYSYSSPSHISKVSLRLVFNIPLVVRYYQVYTCLISMWLLDQHPVLLSLLDERYRGLLSYLHIVIYLAIHLLYLNHLYFNLLLNYHKVSQLLSMSAISTTYFIWFILGTFNLRYNQHKVLWVIIVRYSNIHVLWASSLNQPLYSTMCLFGLEYYRSFNLFHCLVVILS